MELIRSPDDAIEIMLDVNTRIQILDELSHLAGARKHQFAAFIRQERCLVVWADEVETIIPSAEALEQRMMNYVWQSRHDELAVLEAETKEDEEGWIDQDAEKERQLVLAEEGEEQVGAEPGSWEMRDKRPVMLYAPLVSGLAIILTCLFIGSGMRKLIFSSVLRLKLMNRTTHPGMSARCQLGPSRSPRYLSFRLPSRHLLLHLCLRKPLANVRTRRPMSPKLVLLLWPRA